MASVLPEWKLYALELDSSGRQIGEFFESQGYPVNRVNPIEGRESLLLDFCTLPETIEEMIAEAVPVKGKVLALSSHGHYHHLTYGLCKRADKLSREYGYIHIDRHNDLFGMGLERNSPNIHCGRFVKKLCENTNVGKTKLRPDVFFIGCYVPLAEGIFYLPALQYAFTGVIGGAISDMFCSFDRHLDRLPEDVYVTVDLDVLAPPEVRTAWDRGSMKAEKLYQIIRKIKSRKSIISADIVGYTTSNMPMSMYDGDKDFLFEDVRDEPEPPFAKSMKVYKTLADIIMEK